jgi:hypothetical protein
MNRPDDATVRTSETSVHFNVTTQCYVTEDSKLQGYYSFVLTLSHRERCIVYFVL